MNKPIEKPAEKPDHNLWWGIALLVPWLCFMFVGPWVADYNKAVAISGLSASERIQLQEYEAQQKWQAQQDKLIADQQANANTIANAKQNCIDSIDEFGVPLGFLFGPMALIMGLVVGNLFGIVMGKWVL